MLLQKLKERIKPFSCNMQYVSLQWNVQMINLCQDNPLDTALNGYKKVHLLCVYLVHIFFIRGLRSGNVFSKFFANCQRKQWAESYRRELSNNNVAVSPSIYDYPLWGFYSQEEPSFQIVEKLPKMYFSNFCKTERTIKERGRVSEKEECFLLRCST